jgi:hypothetical protein
METEKCHSARISDDVSRRRVMTGAGALVVAGIASQAFP